MHPRLTTTAIAALLCVAASQPAVARAHAHRHAGHVPATPAAPQAPARRYATDAPLRKGMASLLATVEALGHYEHGHMGPQQAVLLATRIEADVDGIIRECRLPPDADAALHAILLPLLGQARALKAEPTDFGAIPPMRAALADYERLFDDPGFGAEPEEDR
jgi:hypothetical protein